MNKSDARAFYAEILIKEKEVEELKTEIEAAIESFASSNNLAPKGIKKSIKEFKEYEKNKARFLVIDGDADKLFEALAGE